MGLHRIEEGGPGSAEVLTVSDLWQTANWQEREGLTCSGSKFTGHPIWCGLMARRVRQPSAAQGLSQEKRQPLISPRLLAELRERHVDDDKSEQKTGPKKLAFGNAGPRTDRGKPLGLARVRRCRKDLMDKLNTAELEGRNIELPAGR